MTKARIHHSLRLRRTTHEHAAYGEELSEPEFDTNRMKFTGHERDPETNLDYMLARYYASKPGTFLQPDPGYDYDPMDPMSWNLYGYVRGNPVMGVDPSGMVLETDELKRMEQIAGVDADLIHDNDGDGNIDQIDATQEQLDNNKGLALLNNLVSSSNVYYYDESDCVDTVEGERNVEGGVENLDHNEDWRWKDGKPDRLKPTPNYDSVVVQDTFVPHPGTFGCANVKLTRKRWLC